MVGTFFERQFEGVKKWTYRKAEKPNVNIIFKQNTETPKCQHL